MDSDRMLPNGALMSECKAFRYRLWRTMPGQGRMCRLRVLFIMLNPSTADSLVDDPTIRKCRGFTERLGGTRFDVVNLFAFRATDAAELRSAADPVGPLNGLEVITALKEPFVHRIVAWGSATKAKKLMEERRDWFAGFTAPLRMQGVSLSCLGTTKDGNPRHPLMLSYDTKLEPWTFPR